MDIARKIQQLRNDGDDEFADVIERTLRHWRACDLALEDINKIMWESYMVTGREFGRNQGKAIMEVIVKWCEADAMKIKDGKYSNDGGVTWQPMERGLPLPYPEDDLMIPRVAVADALAELRATYIQQRGVICYNAVSELDAVIVKLGLGSTEAE